MRVRTDGKLGFPAWPALKSSSPQADRGVAATSKDSLEDQSFTKLSGSGLKGMLPGTSWGMKKREATYSKRKISVSDVMTTVQEMSLDSRKPLKCNSKDGRGLHPTATIPGHLPGRPLHPGIERSLSVPDHTLHRLSDEISDRTPRASEFPQSDDINNISFASKEFAYTEIGKKSTVLMPKELKPLIIPRFAGSKAIIETLRPDTFNDLSPIPPEVPPKSPRTESRASPRMRKTPHSANSSVSTIHSAASSASGHSVNDTWSPRPLQASSRNASPSSHLRGMEIVCRTPPSARSDISPSRLRDHDRAASKNPATLWTHVGRSQSPSLSSAPASRKPSRSPTRCEFESEVATSDPSPFHQRERSELLLSDEAQRSSLKRGDTTSIHGLIRTIANGPTQYRDNFDMPSGFRAIDATSRVPEAEAKALKSQADRHVKRFEVLQVKDVSMLSQELELLDERCEYLQSTHKSLRQGRKNLHTRMITYLRSPRMANFSRESILRQEEALAELDVSIDDWVAKLEAAEERRTTIRQRLLEHVAAALTLQTNVVARPSYLDEATPPVSPEKEEDFLRNARKDVQSIRIYADEGVTALLAEIEKEIDYISEPGNLG